MACMICHLKTFPDTNILFNNPNQRAHFMGTIKYLHDYLLNNASLTCKHIETPILEHASLFLRSLGADTDVVMKEMYSFEDLSGNKLALRPENTAG